MNQKLFTEQNIRDQVSHAKSTSHHLMFLKKIGQKNETQLTEPCMSFVTVYKTLFIKISSFQYQKVVTVMENS